MLALNGTPLLILLIILALLLVGGTVWGWPRLSRQSVLTVFSRISLICVTQFVVLSMVAVMVNDNFEFYTSWSDLMGTVQGGGTVAAQPAGDTTQSAEVIAIGKPGTQGLGGSDPAKVGQLRTVKIEGAVSGLSEEAVIYLPPQYFQAPYKTAQFPAVIAASGYPGSASEVATKFHLPNLLLADLQAKRTKPMVLIMVSPMIVNGRDTECTDVPGGPQAETFWAQDIPSAIESAYRVSTQRSGWGIMGASTGGYCALKIAMMDSNQFSAGATVSGYYAALEDHTTGDLYGDSTSFRNENDLMWRAQNLPSPPVAVLLAAAKVGDPNYQPTLQFMATVKGRMQVSTLFAPEGGHNLTSWIAQFPAVLDWLGLHLTGPLPTPSG